MIYVIRIEDDEERIIKTTSDRRGQTIELFFLKNATKVRVGETETE